MSRLYTASPVAPIYAEKRAEGMASASGLLRLLAVAALGLMIWPGLAAAAVDHGKLEQSYGKLPLSFEANQGQSNAQVKFLARGPGYAVFLTQTEAVLSLKKPQAQRTVARNMAAPSEPADGAVLRMRLVGANPVPIITAREVLPGKVNYLKGKNPAHWHTKIPTYAKVAYAQVYPGIDLVYYGNQRQLEYDFVVAPGADPHAPTLSFEGADRLEIDPRGELVVHTVGGELRMHRPFIYQEAGGVRQLVGGGYVRKNERQVGFEIAAYDRARPLVIDPVLVYSTYLGGSGAETGFFSFPSGFVAVDPAGNAYVTGSTLSADFPTQDPMQPASGGVTDAFVAKLNTTGTALRYSTYLGGSSVEEGSGIAVDNRDNAYVTGSTFSADFPTQDPLQPTPGDDFFLGDVFVVKLNTTGIPRYSTYLGGNSEDRGSGIAVDRAGNAYVTGWTWSADFPTKGPVQPASGGPPDAFVAKLNSRGNVLRYSTYLGGSSDDRGSSIAVNRTGNAYVTGDTFSTDFPTQAPLQPALSGDVDAFVAKLNTSGIALRYSTYLGGGGEDRVSDIAVDRVGNAYVTGDTRSIDFPTQTPLQPALLGDIDAFVAKLNVRGTALRYSTYLGGTVTDFGHGIAVDRAGNTYVTGETLSTDFPTKNPVQPASGGAFDAFVAKLNISGTALRYSTYLGGSENDVGFGIAVDRQGDAYVTGATLSTDFPTKNPVQPASGGDFDAFVTKIGP